MLQALTIQNVALIERIALTFEQGLCVLTGETGAGKSILLDSLGLALGARADAALVAHGADRAVVAAAFAPADGALGDLLAEADVVVEPGEPLILRRVVTPDGRSRAFVNDQPVSVGLLRRLGSALVEIQGQLEQHGLLDAATHRVLLDRFAASGEAVDAVHDAWTGWRSAERALGAARDAAATAERDEAFLRHALEELDSLAPEACEETSLAERRAFLMSRERIVEALNAAEQAIAGDVDFASALGAAARALERAADKAGGRLDEALAALDRTRIELAEALNALQAAAGSIDADSDTLVRVEERLFALREIARKHRVAPDALPELRRDLRARLDAIEHGEERIAELERTAAAARLSYRQAADTLSEARREAAGRLERLVATELPPLRLDKARFRVAVTPLDERDWGATGADRVLFEVSTNPGAPFGPLGRIASGGELARFMLAIKLALSETGGVATIVFDEVDAGIGGATAAAVGERLARLGRRLQVLVVTHSPQVAALGGQHLHVEKRTAGERAVTHVAELAPAARREEIARMLSGAAITEEARAAADSLLLLRPAV